MQRMSLKIFLGGADSSLARNDLHSGNVDSHGAPEKAGISEVNRIESQ